MSYIKDVEDAEEITQDVFVTIFRKAHQFKGLSKVSTWIYSITINKAINQVRKNKRKPTNIEDATTIVVTDFVHPGVLLENKELSIYLFKAIDTLVEKQQTAFILSYVEGLPRKEVAAIMDTTLKSVEGLLQRAKANLKNEIMRMYPEGKLKK